MAITIKRAVRVKVIVTEEFKAHRSAAIGAAIVKLDGVAKRIEFELDSVSKRTDRGQHQGAVVMERLQAEQRRNEQARAALAGELEQIASLELGSEYDRGSLEGLVEVDVGDDFAKLSSCEIVVKDDKIVEIRDG